MAGGTGPNAAEAGQRALELEEVVLNYGHEHEYEEESGEEHFLHDEDDDFDAQVRKMLAQQREFAGESPEDIRAAIDDVQKFPTAVEGLDEGSPFTLGGETKCRTKHHAREEPFNPKNYTEFNFKLRKLYNLRSASSESTGDYTVRICFMGRVLGEYVSGPVDLVSLTQLSRHSQRVSKHLHCPSLTLLHELSMHLRFRDLLDNPVLRKENMVTAAHCRGRDRALVIAVTLARGGVNEDGEPHPPFAYSCLNVIELVKKGGKSNKIIQLWILMPERIPPDSNFICGFPLISLDILGFTGLPTAVQLEQGNIMSVIVESMYRVPPEVLKLAHNPEIASNMDIHFQLPHASSEFESTMVFPGGQFKKMISSRGQSEPATNDAGKKMPHTTNSSTSQFSAATTSAQIRSGSRAPPPSTSNAFNLPDVIEPKLVQSNEDVHVSVYRKRRGYRHWASVLDYFPDAPYGVSIVSGKQTIPRIPKTIKAVGDIENSGDSWREELTSSDTRIVWNALHRHYIGLDAYKLMLEKLSKRTIWPLEVAITIQRETPMISGTDKLTLHSGSNATRGSLRHAATHHGSGQADSSTQLVIVYHGVAFVDLTHLLYPGVNRARFIHQLFPFNEVLFKAKTHAMTSAFLQTIRQSIDIQPPTNSPLAGNANETAKRSAHGRGNKAAGTEEQHRHNRKKSNASDSAKVHGHKQHHKISAHSRGEHQHGSKHTNPAPAASYESHLPSLEDLLRVRVSLLEESQMSTLPFIVFHIRLRRPLVPAVESIQSKAVRKSLKSGFGAFPRRKLMNSVNAEKQFRSSVLVATDELSHEFYTEFLESVIKDGAAKDYLDPTKAAFSEETVKKHFLLHLIATGKYSTLRADLSRAVSTIIQQNSTRLQPTVFGSSKEHQQFLNYLYAYLVDKLNRALNSMPSAQAESKVNSKRKGKKKRCTPKTHKRKNSAKKVERRRKLDQLLMFSQEAFAQGDYENAHRTLVQRITESGDSTSCWADFAVMWLARGDDRLAEVALREALLKNSRNIKALVLSGMIAARQSDKRTIICLGAALNLRPNCPEIMVLLAMAHSCLGNEVASEYYFKKARFVYHILTGQDLSQIEAEFKEIAARVPKDMLHSHPSALETAVELGPRQSHFIHKQSTVEPDEVPSAADSKTAAKDEVSPSTLQLNENEDGGGAITNVGAKFSTSQGQETHEAPQTGKPNHYVFNQHYHFNTQAPEFNFSNLVQEVKAGLRSKLPSMGQCLTQTWNVTKRLKSEKDQRFDEHELGQESGRNARHIHGQERVKAQDVTQVWVNPKQKTSGGVAVVEGPGEVENAGEGVMERNDGQPDSGSKLITTRRMGSELIWTAHLLMKLRLFDVSYLNQLALSGSALSIAALIQFLDGVLARELAFRPERSVRVLYLRALSLHLRGRNDEAIIFAEEAIEKEPENVSLWALRGHCCYRLKIQREAFESYEKALKVPPGKANLLLVYLRFGVQCLEKGLTGLAKKVFHKGVQKFPSPYMWISLGNTCSHLKKFSEAETAFAEANHLNNTSPIIWAHLSLVSHALGDHMLAEQAYKWAIRYGLKAGSRLLNELEMIRGALARQRIPQCIPHRYYLQRLGQENPLEAYKHALNFYETTKQGTREFENSERQQELIRGLQGTKPVIDKSVLEQLTRARQKELTANQKQHTSITEAEAPPVQEQEAPIAAPPEENVEPPEEELAASSARTRNKSQEKGTARKSLGPSRSRTSKKGGQKRKPKKP